MPMLADPHFLAHACDAEHPASGDGDCAGTGQDLAPAIKRIRGPAARDGFRCGHIAIELAAERCSQGMAFR